MFSFINGGLSLRKNQVWKKIFIIICTISNITINQYFTFPRQLTLSSLIGRGCGIVQGWIQTLNSNLANLCYKILQLVSFLNIHTIRSSKNFPYTKILHPRTFLIHTPRLLSFNICSSQDIFKSRH